MVFGASIGRAALDFLFFEMVSELFEIDAEGLWDIVTKIRRSYNL
jgi:hypothetical protein